MVSLIPTDAMLYMGHTRPVVVLYTRPYSSVLLLNQYLKWTFLKCHQAINHDIKIKYFHTVNIVDYVLRGRGGWADGYLIGSTV